MRKTIRTDYDDYPERKGGGVRRTSLNLILVLICGIQFLIATACFASGKTVYIFANGGRIAKVENNKTSYYLADQVGSTSIVVDEQGIESGRSEYYPFGDELAGRGSVGDYRFTGKELDQSTGLYYFGARYYEPGVGRWLAVDPLLSEVTREFPISDSPLSVSPYNYVLNRPTVLTDPDGECPICVGALIGAGLDVAGQFAQSIESGRSEFSFSGFTDFIVRPSDQGGLDLTQTVTSAAIGATGAGLSTQIGKVITGTGARAIIGRAVANAVGNAAVGAGVDKAQGKDFNAKKTGINLAGGAVGSALGDAIIAGSMVDDVVVLGGEALHPGTSSNLGKSLSTPMTTVSPSAQAIADVASNTFANSGNLVQPTNRQDLSKIDSGRDYVKENLR